LFAHESLKIINDIGKLVKNSGKQHNIFAAANVFTQEGCIKTVTPD
jgi:hypothetical protein